MKKKFIFLIFLLAFYINGCEDGSSNKKIDNIKKEQLEKKPVKELVQSSFKVKKKNIKKKVFKTAEKPESIEPVQSKPILDLSIPGKYNTPTLPKNTSNYKKRSYLPDLFTEKKNQKDEYIKIDGEVILKQEEETDKQRALDGIGVAIKLSP